MLNPGDRFGDYTVARLLGKGGMGAVYLLEDAAGAQVAAKILEPATAGDARAFAMALRKGKNVLAVTLKGNSGGSYFDCGLTVETAEAGEPRDQGGGTAR